MQRQKKSQDNKNLVNLNTRVPEDLVMEVKIFCIRNKMSIQDFVTEALKEKLKAKN